MNARVSATLAAIACAVLGALANAATPVTVLTTPIDTAGHAMARDLAALVAPHADIDLKLVPATGSATALSRLRNESGARLAIVPADAYQTVLDGAARGHVDAADLARALRVVLPLHGAEIHLVVRADSRYRWLDDLRDARINLGPVGGNAAITTANLYRLMFGGEIPAENASHLADEDALVRLVTDRTIDVVAIVAGQPARLLADMKPEARRYVRLLRYDPRDSSSAALLSAYRPATLRSTSYPSLIDDDLPALAVPSLLMTFEPASRATRDTLVRFARALCRNFAALEARGHRKWREVRMMLPDLGPGISYYAPTANELYGCIADRAAGMGQ